MTVRDSITRARARTPGAEDYPTSKAAHDRMLNPTQLSIGVRSGPPSASKRDPLVLRFERLALAASELEGVAETARARVVGWLSLGLLGRLLSLPVSTMSQ